MEHCVVSAPWKHFSILGLQRRPTCLQTQLCRGQCLSLCMFMWVQVHMCADACTPVYVQVRGQPWAPSSVTLHLVFFEAESLTFTRNSLIPLGWLVQGCPGPACLCLYSSGITSFFIMPSFFHMGSGINFRSLCSCDKHITNCTISPAPEQGLITPFCR